MQECQGRGKDNGGEGGLTTKAGLQITAVLMVLLRVKHSNMELNAQSLPLVPTWIQP